MPTKEEIGARAEGLLENEVFWCQSCLVGDLLNLGGETLSEHTRELGSAFSWEEVENLYHDPEDWTISQCRQHLDDYGCDRPERPLGGGDELEVWHDAVRDMDPQEVFEWWLVSEQLAGALSDMGVPVLRNDYGNWWGRTCTGQQLIMDGTLQKVAKQILES